ncbi:MAG: hypothetical protein BWY76_00205 [bacterium ADurb.Bin429]|nr:MAG: hypothetical protein BWY76_00205 [bacterium ADurb.Bin429]
MICLLMIQRYCFAQYKRETFYVYKHVYITALIPIYKMLSGKHCY